MNNLEKLRELSTRLVSMQSSLASFFQFCPDMLCIVNSKGYFVRLNPAWETILGYTLEELMSVPCDTFIHPDDLQSTIDISKLSLSTEGVYNFINRYRHKDGTYRYLSWTSTAFIEEEQCYAVARDVTKERETELKLSETQDELQDFFENAPIALHWANEYGVILWANKEELNLLGYTKEEYTGRNVCDFYKDQTQCRVIFNKLIQDEVVTNFRTKLVRKNGEYIDAVISANVLKRKGQFIHTRNFTKSIPEFSNG